MKFKVGDQIKIIDPVPTPGDKWGMSGYHGVVKETFPIKMSAIDDFLIDRSPQHVYTLELWSEFIPENKHEEPSVRETIIEFRN